VTSAPWPPPWPPVAALTLPNAAALAAGRRAVALTLPAATVGFSDKLLLDPKAGEVDEPPAGILPPLTPGLTRGNLFKQTPSVVLDAWAHAAGLFISIIFIPHLRQTPT
jgi:hypothetical protein